jgi:hypothetical protein
MTFSFTEIEGRADHGGVFTIEATSPKDKAAVIAHFRLPEAAEPLALAELIMSPEPLIHSPSPGSRDNAAWFNVTSSLPLEFTTPYYKELCKRTGYEGRGILPDIPAEFFAPYLDRMAHTHYPIKVWTEGGHLSYDTIVSCQDWNKIAAADYAPRRAAECFASKLGRREACPEFIELGNGTFRKNPAYPRINPAQPALESHWFFGIVIDWWLLHTATPQQRELVETSGALMFANHRGVSCLHNLREYYGVRVAWDDKVRIPSLYTWKEFAALGA